MTSAPAARHDERPLVAVICHVPLLEEALEAAVGDVLTVRSFPPDRDTSGLLGWLRPDGIVVDSEQEAANALPFASEWNIPLLHVSLAARTLRVLNNGVWEQPQGTALGPETVRNIMVGGIFGKGRAR
jgi:hypothetical protein